MINSDKEYAYPHKGQCLNLQQKNDMMKSLNERNNVWQIYMTGRFGQS